MNKNVAIEYLKYVSEKTIIFYTGVCVMESDTLNYKTDIAVYKIKIKNLNNNQIINYVEKHKPY